LSDIIASRPEVEALKVLEIVCGALKGRKLKSIDLSDNALGEKVSTTTTTTTFDTHTTIGSIHEGVSFPQFTTTTTTTTTTITSDYFSHALT